ncbi:MAG TPA: cysteine peptidase family C39 domain-containing protein, partial [Nitrospira sp.]|nr:cysteine peptidase family C39 domain-containing protein [Nitrospira sp.]
MIAQAVAENADVDPMLPSGLECLVIVARPHGLDLTSTQLIKDNLLTDGEVAPGQLVRCAEKAGLRSKHVKLDWDGLSHLKKALPAIVGLRNGSYMVLLRVDGDANNTRIALRDPNAAEDALLVIDRPRFEDIWSGDVVLAKRNYEISDESQPFSFGFVAALIFRERRIVRDVAIAALVLGFLGLAPIMFWRLLSDKVIFYHAFNTFYVLCLAMLVIIAFEATFAFLRQILVHRLTTRLDV